MVCCTFTNPPDHWPWQCWDGGRLLLQVSSLPVDYLAQPGLQANLLRGALQREATFPEPEFRCLRLTDVVAVQLYKDCLTHPRPRGATPLPDYEETLVAMYEMGPHIGGFMVGNQLGLELSYRHCYGSWRGDAVANCTAIAEFVREVGNLIHNLGTTPFFSIMNWDIIQDAYKGGRRILAALNEVEATNYIACGYAMVPGAYIKPGLDETGDHLRWQSELLGRGWRLPDEGEDFPVLQDYLGSGYFWSGLCGLTGIMAGNMQILGDYGFRGFATKMQPSEQQELIEALGPDWWT